jgi:hypothetical protein
MCRRLGGINGALYEQEIVLSFYRKVMYGSRNVHTGFLWKYIRETDHLEDPSVDGRSI